MSQATVNLRRAVEQRIWLAIDGAADTDAMKPTDLTKFRQAAMNQTVVAIVQSAAWDILDHCAEHRDSMQAWRHERAEERRSLGQAERK